MPPISCAFVREYRPSDAAAVRRLKWHHDACSLSVVFALRADPAGHGDIVVSTSCSQDFAVIESTQKYALNLRAGDVVVMDNRCVHAVTEVTGPESRWSVAVFFGHA